MSKFVSSFPSIIHNLQKKEFSIPGIHVYVEKTSKGMVYYVENEVEATFDAHSHGEQFTIVVNGYADVTMNGTTTRYSKGETYLIPAGTEHTIYVSAGYAEIDYVEDEMM